VTLTFDLLTLVSAIVYIGNAILANVWRAMGGISPKEIASVAEAHPEEK